MSYLSKMTEQTPETALDYLKDKVHYLQLSCNVMTLDGYKCIATFGYINPVDFHGVMQVGTVEGGNIFETLRKVCHFIDSLEPSIQ